jgi:hypothetical protein
MTAPDRLRLTRAQTDRLRRWVPPEEGCGPEWDAVLDRVCDRMAFHKTVALDADEAQVFAIFMDDFADDLDPAEARLAHKLAVWSGLAD